LPNSIESKIIRYVHTSSGHLGVETCVAEIAHMFHVKNLRWKVRQFVSCCDTCQRVKQANRGYMTNECSHVLSKPGSLCALDIYGHLPKRRGSVKYILNKLTSDYTPYVIHPQCILTGNGTQFEYPSERKKLAELNIAVRYSPVRHLQTNPSQRHMCEISKFCKIYCHQTHKKWADVVPYTENWLNTTISGSTGYTAV
ncbi:hypothetical protein Cfor_09980, partial [Coptotermes formosanus]